MIIINGKSRLRTRRGSPRSPAGTLATIVSLLAAAFAQSAPVGGARSRPPVDVSRSTPSSWSAPETIATGELGDDETPTPLAIDSRGDAVAVWSEASISGLSVERRIRGAVRLTGGHWGAPSTLPGAGIGPQLAVDERGNATAVWQADTSPYGVQSTTRTLRAPWAHPTTLAGVYGANPQVASDARGDSIVVWSRTVRGHLTDPESGIKAAIRPAGGAFGPVEGVSSSENAGLPRLVMNARGDALVAWEVDLGQGCEVRAAFRPTHGRWESPHTLSDAHAGCRAEQKAAIDPRGDAVVVWYAEHGSAGSVEGAERSAQGRWTSRRVLTRAGVVNSPDVEMDARGDAIAVWSELIGNTMVVQARTHPVGRNWQRPQDLSHADGGRPSLAVDASGNALVAWSGRGAQIEVTSRRAGGQWQQPQNLAHRLPGGTPPLAVIDAQGEGLVAWEDDAGIETAWHRSLFR